MLKFCLVFLITLVGLSLCYDFKDFGFNELLMDEFKSASLPVENSFRLKRDAESKDEKCSPARNMHCCKTEQFNPTQFESFKTAKMECYNEINGDEEVILDPFDCESAKKVKENIICISECVTKKLNVLNENNELDREKVVEYFKVKYANEPWKLERTEEVVDTCLPKIKMETSDENRQCNDQALKMLHCMWKEFVLKCPKDMQIDSVKCNKIREKIEQNDEAFIKAIKYRGFIKMFQREH